MEKALSEILKNTFTKADLYARLGLLQEILERMYFQEAAPSSGEEAFNVALKHLTSYSKSDREAVAEWHAHAPDLFTEKKFVSSIETLKKGAEALSEFTLYLPAAPRPEDVAVLGSWCRVHIARQLMLRILIDANVVGGCAFVHKDVLHDFSWNYFARTYNGQLAALLPTL